MHRTWSALGSCSECLNLTAQWILTAVREEEDHSYFVQTFMIRSETDSYLT